MIKRALGLFVDGTVRGGDDDDDYDSEDDFTPAQRQKLERRLLPGVKRAQDDEDGAGEKGSKKKGRFRGVPLNSDDSGSDSDSDAELVMPPAATEEKPWRGNFHCQLCPDKIILTEKALELHLNSQKHKRNESAFQRAKEIGVEAFEAECRERAEATERAKQGPSKTQLKKEKFWQKRRETRRRKTAAEKAAKLSTAQIELRKQYFQAKKERRLARKQAESGSGAPAPPAKGSVEAEGRKAKAGKDKDKEEQPEPKVKKKKKKQKLVE